MAILDVVQIIAVFFGTVIRMFYKEHEPSHFNAEHQGQHAKFDFVGKNDHSEATLDFSQWLHGPIFEPPKKPAYFRRLFVEGGTVVWPNRADVAPETLCEAAGATRSDTAPQRTARNDRERRG